MLQSKLTYQLKQFEKALKSHVQMQLNFVNMLINFVNLQVGFLHLEPSSDVLDNKLCNQYEVLFELLGRIFTDPHDSKWILDNLEFKLTSQLRKCKRALRLQVKTQLDFVIMLISFVNMEIASVEM